MDFSADRPTCFINPDYRPMAGANKPVIDPATLETVGAIAAASDGEIDAVLAAATKASGVEEARRQEPCQASACRRQRHRGGRLHPLC